MTRLAAAMAEHDAGRLDAAEAGYRRVLQDDPDEPDALNLLGALLQERGELAASIAMLTRALAVEPAFPEALANLSRATRLAGDAAAAADLARRAIAQDSGLTEAWVNLAWALIDLGNDPGAAVALDRAVGLAPDAADIHACRATVLLRLNDRAGAARALGALLAAAPDRVDAMIALGQVLVSLDRLDEALHWHRTAVERAPDDATAHAALAGTLRARQDIAGAIAGCRRGLALAPDRTDIQLDLAANLTILGCFAEAEQCCLDVLARDPDSPAARRELAVIGRLTREAAELPRLRATLADAAAPRMARVAAGMAVGRFLDRTGEYDAAFAAFAAANALIRAHWRDAGEAFNAAAFRRQIDWSIDAFPAGRFAETRDWGDPSELPVFIVGMPRSGTSLVEQIAASHPAVFGAGERKDIVEIARRLSAAGAWRPSGLAREAVRRAATAQIDRLRAVGGAAARVTDKLPDNVLVLGQIATLFPRARVIVCRRDLRDVCLSCHFQHFSDGLAWTTDLAELATRAREVERLLAHWLKVLPIPVLEIHYETLVANLEAESRRLIDFLGLEWDPACLRFHETERPVMTASVWQVRQPLYDSSVGRWRHYRAHLGPLLEGLTGLVAEG